MKDNPIKNAMLKIQVASLTGGHIVRTTPANAQEAAALGAIGVLVKPPSESWLDSFLEQLTIHPLCCVKDYDRYSEIYERHAEPGCFVLAETTADVSSHRVFPVLKSEEDLRSIDKATLLLVVQNPDLLSRALKARDKVDPAMPVFSAVRDEDQALSSLRLGADGTIVPESADLHSLLDRWLADHQPTAIDPSFFNIGVVALQGDYRFHIEQLRRLISDDLPTRPIRIVPIRQGEDLKRCDAAVLPGGWSNLQTILYDKTKIVRVVKSFKDEGKPILGICAGMILAGTGYGRGTKNRTLLELIDATIDNNILNGSALAVEVAYPDGTTVPGQAAFSNGPFARELGDGIETITRLVDPKALSRLRKKGVLRLGEECIVAARQGSVLIASYHEGPGTHDVFINACRQRIFEGH